MFATRSYLYNGLIYSQLLLSDGQTQCLTVHDTKTNLIFSKKLTASYLDTFRNLNLTFFQDEDLPVYTENLSTFLGLPSLCIINKKDGTQEFHEVFTDELLDDQCRACHPLIFHTARSPSQIPQFSYGNRVFPIAADMHILGVRAAQKQLRIKLLLFSKDGSTNIVQAYSYLCSKPRELTRTVPLTLDTTDINLYRIATCYKNTTGLYNPLLQKCYNIDFYHTYPIQFYTIIHIETDKHYLLAKNSIFKITSSCFGQPPELISQYHAQSMRINCFKHNHLTFYTYFDPNFYSLTLYTSWEPFINRSKGSVALDNAYLRFQSSNRKKKQVIASLNETKYPIYPFVFKAMTSLYIVALSTRPEDNIAKIFSVSESKLNQVKEFFSSFTIYTDFLELETDLVLFGATECLTLCDNPSNSLNDYQVYDHIAYLAESKGSRIYLTELYCPYIKHMSDCYSEANWSNIDVEFVV